MYASHLTKVALALFAERAGGVVAGGVEKVAAGVYHVPQHNSLLYIVDDFARTTSPPAPSIVARSFTREISTASSLATLLYVDSPPVSPALPSLGLHRLVVPLAVTYTLGGFTIYATPVLPIAGTDTQLVPPLPDATGTLAGAGAVGRAAAVAVELATLLGLRRDRLPFGTKIHGSFLDSGATLFLTSVGFLRPTIGPGVTQTDGPSFLHAYRMELLQRGPADPHGANADRHRLLAATSESAARPGDLDERTEAAVSTALATELARTFVSAAGTPSWRDTVKSLITETSGRTPALVDNVLLSHLARGLLPLAAHRHGINVRSLGAVAAVAAASPATKGLAKPALLEVVARALKSLWRQALREAFVMRDEDDEGADEDGDDGRAAASAAASSTMEKPANVPELAWQQLKGKPYFHPELDRVATEKFLHGRRPCYFVVRPSSKPNSVALSHLDSSSHRVMHALIFERDGSWQLEREPKLHARVEDLLRSLPLRRECFNPVTTGSVSLTAIGTTAARAAASPEAPESSDPLMRVFKRPTAALLDRFIQWTSPVTRQCWEDELLARVEVLFFDHLPTDAPGASPQDRATWRATVLGMFGLSEAGDANEVRLWRDTLLNRLHVLAGVKVASDVRNRLALRNQCPPLSATAITFTHLVTKIVQPASTLPLPVDESRSPAAAAVASSPTTCVAAARAAMRDSLGPAFDLDRAAQAAAAVAAAGNDPGYLWAATAVALRAQALQARADGDGGAGVDEAALSRATAEADAVASSLWAAVDAQRAAVGDGGAGSLVLGAEVAGLGFLVRSVAADAATVRAVGGDAAGAGRYLVDCLERLHPSHELTMPAVVANAPGSSIGADWLRLLHMAAQHLLSCQEFGDASRVLTAAVASERALFGRPNGSTLNALATSHFGADEHELAAEYFGAAAEVAEAKYGPSHVAVAATLDNRGASLCNLERYDEALALHKRALAIYTRNSSATRSAAKALAHCHKNVGNVHLGAGRTSDARAAYEAALTLYRANPGSGEELAETEALLADLDARSASPAAPRTPAQQRLAAGGRRNQPSMVVSFTGDVVETRGLAEDGDATEATSGGSGSSGAAGASGAAATSASPRGAASAPAAPLLTEAELRSLRPRRLMDLAHERGIATDGLGRGGLVKALLESQAAASDSQASTIESRIDGMRGDSSSSPPAPSSPAEPAKPAVNYKMLKPRQLLDVAASRGVATSGRTKFQLIAELEKLDAAAGGGGGGDSSPTGGATAAPVAAAAVVATPAVSAEDAFTDFTWAPATVVQKKQIEQEKSERAQFGAGALNLGLTHASQATPAPSAAATPRKLHKAPCEGYLYKRGALRRNWLRRYFELKYNKMMAIPGAYLLYYEDESKSASAKKSIAVRDIRRVSSTTQSIRKASAVRDHHHFQVVTDDRTYYLAAESPEDRDRWIAAISSWFT